MPFPTLIALPYSPWSERARWALEHHGIAYRLLRHEPFLGQRRLAKLVGPGVKRATVPVLLDGDTKLTDSWDIVLYADRVGSGTKLVPAELEPAIRELAELVDRTLSETRVLVTAGLLASNAALDEALPRAVPRFARPLLRPFSRYGTRWFARKYALALDDLETPRRTLAHTLTLFRERYAGRAYLFERFGYADMLFCSLLQNVSPLPNEYIRLGPAWRAVWTEPALAREFGDLVGVRDRIYAEHRPLRAKSP